MASGRASAMSAARSASTTRALRRALPRVFCVERRHRHRYCRVSATTMDTRCHPAPPRRARACPRTCEEESSRVLRRGIRLLVYALGVVLVVATTTAATELEQTIDDSLALCAA